jgi:hypothetical protein
LPTNKGISRIMSTSDVLNKIIICTNTKRHI